jgi:uncharacterized protein
MSPRYTAHAKFEWGIKIPLRDGVRLNATVYRPQCQKDPLPCILTLTPYVSDRYHKRGVYFAKHGLPFIVVDVRGRGNSEGTFRPYIQEAQDGFDVVEWLTEQPYCNGKVAMWGGSYGGYDQWATAKEFPPGLASIVPIAAPYIGVDFPMRNNIFFPFIAQWITFTSGRASQEQIFSDESFWADIYREWFESGRPFRDVDSVAGNPSAVFQEWIAHPEPDRYWDAYNPTTEQYANLRIPILTITGSNDDDQPGALEHYRNHIRHGSPTDCERHYLVIGPWDHYRTSAPQSEFGGVSFGPESLLDIPKLHLDWYAWTMQGGPKPVFLKKRVAYYVMGAERWRYADSLAKITEKYESWFLDSNGNANDIFSAGVLGSASGSGKPDWYSYDPSNTRGPEVAAEARTAADSLVDQKLTLALRGKLLVYLSAPLERDVEISGFFKLQVWIAIDCPDTDLYVSVHEIDADGGSIRLSTDVMRARYREGLRAPKIIATQDPLFYEFDRFTFVSRLIKKGHRLRLILGPMGRFIQTIFAQKNYNGGGVVTDESVHDARSVTVTLYHDESRPSALHVPIGWPAIPGEDATPASALLQRLP